MAEEAETLEDIARRLRVSRRTVSRVLSGGKNVSLVVRERVTRVLSRTRYVPNAPAARLAGGRVPVLGLVFPRNFLSSMDDYVARIIRGALRATEPAGHQITLMSLDRMDAQEAWRFFRGRLAGGFVFVAFGAHDEAEMQDLRSRGVPLAAVNFRAQGVDSLDCDNRQGGYEATRHLLGLGRRRIAFLHGRDEWSSARERREGYAQAMDEAKVAINPGWVVEAHFEPAAADQAVTRFLSGKKRPDAIFAANDIMMIAAYGALRRHGLRVPEDIALVGFDDIPLCSTPLLEVTLSSVSQPLEAIAQAAAERVIALASGGGADRRPQHRLFAPQLNIRESSGGAAPVRGAYKTRRLETAPSFPKI